LGELFAGGDTPCKWSATKAIAVGSEEDMKSTRVGKPLNLPHSGCVAVLFALVFVSGCRSPVEPSAVRKQNLSQSVFFSLEWNPAPRTSVLDVPIDEFIIYRPVLQHDDKSGLIIVSDWKCDAPVPLSMGKWNVTITAFI